MLPIWRSAMLLSDSLAWAIAAAIPLVPLMLALAPHYVVLPPMGQAALDRLLAFISLHMLLVPFVRWSTAGQLASWRAVRIVSSIGMSLLLVEALVSLLGRRLLLLAALFHALFAAHALSCAAELSLRLRRGGLLCLLPPRVAHALLHLTPLDVLDALLPYRTHIASLSAPHPPKLCHNASLLLRARALAPLLLLPKEDQTAALALLPPQLRQSLRAPLLEAMPSAVQHAIAPWDHSRPLRAKLSHSSPSSSHTESELSFGSSPAAVEGPTGLGATASATTAATPPAASASLDSRSACSSDGEEGERSLDWESCFAPEQLLLRAARRSLFRRMRRAVSCRLRSAASFLSFALAPLLTPFTAALRCVPLSPRRLSLSFPSFPSFPSCSFPSFPSIPSFPSFPSSISFASFPSLPSLPSLLMFTYSCFVILPSLIFSALPSFPSISSSSVRSFPSLLSQAHLARPSFRCPSVARFLPSSSRASQRRSKQRHCTCWAMVFGVFAYSLAAIIVLCSRAVAAARIALSVAITLAVHGLSPPGDGPAAATNKEGATSCTLPHTTASACGCEDIPMKSAPAR